VTFPEDLALVRLVYPGDAFGEHGLARPVVPAQGSDLPGGKLEVDVVQRLHRSEMLVQPLQPQQGFACRTLLGDGSRHVTSHYLDSERVGGEEVDAAATAAASVIDRF
jgi:hypothetical protein